MELKDLQDRCDEEESLLTWQLQQSQKLKAESAWLAENENGVSLGLAAVMRGHSLQIDKELYRNKKTYELFNCDFPVIVSEYECEYADKAIHDQINCYEGEDTD
eukprot:gene10513-11616_t